MYKIQYVKDEHNVNADVLSRLPNLKCKDAINDVICDKFYLNFILDDVECISDLDLVKSTQDDEILSKVFKCILLNVWPEGKNLPIDLKPYYNKRLELTVENGLILWGHRLVIPKTSRDILLAELHSTHFGVTKMKSIARSYIWWPNIDSDIQKITKSCTSCLENQENPARSELHSGPYPKEPGSRVHIDFLGSWNGHMFFVAIDAFSKWVFIRRMSNITTKSTIAVLQEYVSLFGISKKIISDNETSFCSAEMNSFFDKNGVIHIKTPPYHPSTNGAAENVVRNFKNFLKRTNPKLNTIDFDIQRFLLSYNSTVHCSTGTTPAELHLGRKLDTAFDRFKMVKSQEQQKLYYHGNRTKVYSVGSPVYVRNFGNGPKWIPAKIEKCLSEVTYEVSCNNGLTKRHIDQIQDYCPMDGVSSDKIISSQDNVGFVFPPSPKLDEKAEKPVTPVRPLVSTPTTRYKIPSLNILSRPQRTIKPRVIFNI